MKTCLDCFHCKIKFPINKKDKMLTSLDPNPTKISGKKVYLRVVCTENQWVEPNRNLPGYMLYIEKNIQRAKLGNSRFLNQADRCNFKDMGDFYVHLP